LQTIQQHNFQLFIIEIKIDLQKTNNSYLKT